MTESDQYGPLWKGANSEGWSLFRIADGSVGKKPTDLAGCAPDGRAVLIEVKLFKEPRSSWAAWSPSWQRYEAHQMAWMRRYAEAHALAIAAEYDAPRREMRLFVIEHAEQVGSAFEVRSAVMRKAGDLWAGWDGVLALSSPRMSLGPYPVPR